MRLFFGLYTYNFSVFILANMAKPGDFTEKAYFQWNSKTKKKKKKKKDDRCAVADVTLN